MVLTHSSLSSRRGVLYWGEVANATLLRPDYAALESLLIVLPNPEPPRTTPEATMRHVNAFWQWMAARVDPRHPRLVWYKPDRQDLWTTMQDNRCLDCETHPWSCKVCLLKHVHSTRHFARKWRVNPDAFDRFALSTFRAYRTIAALDGIELEWKDKQDAA